MREPCVWETPTQFGMTAEFFRDHYRKVWDIPLHQYARFQKSLSRIAKKAVDSGSDEQMIIRWEVYIMHRWWKEKSTNMQTHFKK